MVTSSHIRYGVFHPPQYISLPSPSTSSESQKDLESARNIYLDNCPMQRKNVICLGMAKRSYDPDTKEGVPMAFWAVARPILESLSVEMVLHGRLPTGYSRGHIVELGVSSGQMRRNLRTVLRRR